MAATDNKWAFIIDTLTTALTIETTFAVRQSWQSEEPVPNGKALVYCNIIQDRAENVVLEGKYSPELRSCPIGIIARFQIPRSKAGNAKEYYGNVVEKIENQLDTLDTTLKETPALGTSSRYNTNIYGVRRVTVSGFVDDGDEMGVLQMECEVVFTQSHV